MKRLLFSLFAGTLLTAAAPVPVRLTPAQAVLGTPLLLTLELPDAETTLAGLPPLAPFELLAPPRREGNELRLVLLPMRPGRHTLPSFPLHRGRSRQISTAPLTMEVAEGLPDDLEPAPLKELPASAKALPLWPGVPLAAAICVLALFLHRKGRTVNCPPPPVLDELDGEALLAELQRRLEGLRKDGDGRLDGLAQRLERLRFAPGDDTEDAARQLLTDFRALTGGNS